MITAQVAKSKNDEYYTPAYAIQPIKKYIKPNSRIWCPFDTEKSYFVKELKKEGHKVYHSHIDDGVNFFDRTPSKEHIDFIISNPPYSIKLDVFRRLFELGIPFAMLVGVVGLFDSKDKANLFKDHNFEIMYLSPRVSYFRDYDNEVPINGIPFQSVYLCGGMLPKQIIFEEVNKNYQDVGSLC